MKITGNETLSQLVTSFSKAPSGKHLRLNKKQGETTLKIHTGLLKFSGKGEKAAAKRQTKHENAVKFVRDALTRQFPNEQGKIDKLMSDIGKDMISVKQLRNLEREMLGETTGSFDSREEMSETSSSGKLEKSEKVEKQGGKLQLNGLPEEIDFSGAKNFETRSSGNGGVVILETGGVKVAVKDHANGNEILGSRLARELGLPAPETRFLSDKESMQLQNQMISKGQKMPHNSAPTVVMEYVNGVGMEKNDSLKGMKPTEVARQLGRWLALDVLIHEIDRFHGFGLSNDTAASINSANFLVSQDGKIVGIDQNVSGGYGSDAVERLTSDSLLTFMDMGYAISKYAGGDGEDLAEIVKESAQDLFREIGQKLTTSRLDELADGLGVQKEALEMMKSRLMKAIEFAG